MSLAFSVDAGKMHEALAFAMNCVETKTTMPILCHILIRAEGQAVTIQATDLDVAVSMTLEAQVKEPGSLAVIGKPLLAQFVGRSGDAVISTTPNDRMRVKVGSSSALLVGLKAESFPVLASHSGDPVLRMPIDVRADAQERLLCGQEHQQRYSVRFHPRDLWRWPAPRFGFRRKTNGHLCAEI